MRPWHPVPSYEAGRTVGPKPTLMATLMDLLKQLSPWADQKVAQRKPRLELIDSLAGELAVSALGMSRSVLSGFRGEAWGAGLAG